MKSTEVDSGQITGRERRVRKRAGSGVRNPDGRQGRYAGLTTLSKTANRSEDPTTRQKNTVGIFWRIEHESNAYHTQELDGH